MKVVPTLRTAEKPSIVSSFVLISISTASVKCKSVCVCVWLPQPLSLSLLIQQVTHSRCGLIPLCQFAYTYRDPNGSFPFSFICFASWLPFSLLLNLTLLSFHTLQSHFIGHLSLIHSTTTSLFNRHQFQFLFSGFGINQCRVFRYLPALATLRTTFSHNW